MKRIIYFILSICIALTLFSPLNDITVYAASWPTEPTVTADTAILMDAKTGAIIYNKDMDKVMYPASTTKIVTCALACNYLSMTDTITMSANSINTLPSDASRLGVLVGETLTVKDLLYGLMLRSGNELANALAEKISGDNLSFSKLMNEYSKNVGAKSTNFSNPHGLHEDTHYTTAYDLAVITKAALTNPLFCEIWGTERYKMPATNKDDEYTITNRHTMLVSTSEYYYPYAIGGKTGTEDLAGQVLVTVAEKDGLELICVVMHSDNRWTDTQALFNYGFANFKDVNVANNESRFSFSNSSFIYNFNSLLNKNVSAFSTNASDCITIPKDLSFKDTTYTVEFANSTATTAPDVPVATLSYYYSTYYLGKTSLYLTNGSSSTFDNVTSSSSSSMNDSKLLTINVWYILIALVALLILVFIVLLFRKHYKRTKARRQRRYRHKY